MYRKIKFSVDGDKIRCDRHKEDGTPDAPVLYTKKGIHPAMRYLPEENRKEWDECVEKLGWFS